MKAYFVCGVELEEKIEVFNGVELAVPVLTAEKLREIASAVVEARERSLKTARVEDLVDLIDEVAHRWRREDDPYRLRAMEYLPQVTGYSRPMIAAALDELFMRLRAPFLWELLEEEFNEPEVLDGFRSRRIAEGMYRAFAPPLITHVLAGNIPDISVQSLVCGLLVKSASLAKSASGDPLLPVLFAESLHAIDTDVAKSIAVLWWKGGAQDLEDAAFRSSELVVAYGNDETLNDLRRRIPPRVRFVGYGHRLSFGVVSRECVSREVAVAAAKDTCWFDQRGCLSPHLFYVERGGEDEAKEFSRWLAEAMDELSKTLPVGQTSPAQATQIQNWRDTYELRGASVHASPGSTQWTVVYDPNPEFTPSCLGRFALVKPIDELEEIVVLVAPIRAYLQAVGLAVPRERAERLVEQLAGLGVTRFCPLGSMQQPAITWHHDGRFNLLDWVRLVDWEG